MSDDLALLNVTQLAQALGLERHKVAAMVKAGRIPPAFIDENDRAWFSLATVRAAQQRAGELFAEGSAA